MFIIDDLLLAPIRILKSVFEEFCNHIQQEMDNELNINKQLVELQFLYEMGEISQKEYEQREKELIDRIAL